MYRFKATKLKFENKIYVNQSTHLLQKTDNSLLFRPKAFGLKYFDIFTEAQVFER